MIKMASNIEAVTYGKELRESVEECMKKLDQVIATVNGLNIPDVSQLTSDVATLKTDMDKVKITLYTPVTKSES
jgi:hypothetical protein